MAELAVSGILERPDPSGAIHPIAYESRKLTAPERAYPPHPLELLAVVHCLKSFRPYLLGRSFVLRTDNASLQWFLQQRSLNRHQARWLNTVSEFQFSVVHIPGRLNPADHLSRMRSATGEGPAPTTGYGDGSSEFFHVGSTAPACVFTQIGSPWMARDFSTLILRASVAAATAHDPFLGRILRQSQLLSELVDKTGCPVPADSTSTRTSFFARDGLLFWHSSRSDRLCIPEVPALRQLNLTELHATPLGGHFGRDKTLSLAQRSVWWTSFTADVETFISNCLTCQRVKAEYGRPAGLLFPLSALLAFVSRAGAE